MPKFGAASLKQHATLHPQLQQLMDEAIKYFDFSIIEGYRGKDAQDAAYAKGNSKVKYPNSKHNRTWTDGAGTHPHSWAVDIAPYPIDWSNKQTAIERFVFLMGHVRVIALQLGIKVRFGLDWDGDNDMRDESFRDYPHIELLEE